MDPSANLRDERIKLKSRNVSIKNRSFNAYLTNKRLILLDSDDPRGESSRDIDRNDIVMARSGEDLSGTPTLNISVKASNGEIKRMIITFIGAPEERSEELSEWVAEIRDGILSRKEIENDNFGIDEPVVPAAGAEPGITRPAPAASQAPEISAKPAGQFTFCPNCGEKLITQSRFCHACGSDLGTPGVESRTPPESPAMHQKPEQPPITDPLMQTANSYGSYQRTPEERYDPVAPAINDQISLGGTYDGRRDPMGYPPHPPTGAYEPPERVNPAMYPGGGDIGYPPAYDEQIKRGRQKKQKEPKQKKAKLPKPPRPPKVKKQKSRGGGDAIYGYPDYGHDDSGGKVKIIGMAVVGILVIVVVLAAMGHIPFLKLPVSSGNTSTTTPVATVSPGAGSTTSPTTAPTSSPSAVETELTTTLQQLIDAFNSNNANGVYNLFSDAAKAQGANMQSIQEEINSKLNNNENLDFNVISVNADNSLFVDWITREADTGTPKTPIIPKTIPFVKDGEVWKINLYIL